MIPIALLGLLSSKTFITEINGRHITKHSGKSNKLRNVNPVRGKTRNKEIYYVKSHRAYHKFRMKQIRLKKINVKTKMGLQYHRN